VGLNVRSAENGGVNVNRAIIGGMAMAGALAGMTGANYVLGYKHYFEEGLGRGVGFMGIAVALLGRNHPIGIIGAALLFGTLSQGGLAVNALVPKELVDVLQAVIILAVAATSAAMRRRYERKGIA
jgi:simple sugar transport system permease protein